MPRFFWIQKSVDQLLFGPKHFFGPKDSLNHKNFWTPKFFWAWFFKLEKNCWIQKCFGVQENFWNPKHIWDQKWLCELKYFWDPHKKSLSFCIAPKPKFKIFYEILTVSPHLANSMFNRWVRCLHVYRPHQRHVTDVAKLTSNFNFNLIWSWVEFSITLQFSNHLPHPTVKV